MLENKQSKNIKSYFNINLLDNKKIYFLFKILLEKNTVPNIIYILLIIYEFLSNFLYTFIVICLYNIKDEMLSYNNSNNNFDNSDDFINKSMSIKKYNLNLAFFQYIIFNYNSIIFVKDSLINFTLIASCLISFVLIIILVSLYIAANIFFNNNNNISDIKYKNNTIILNIFANLVVLIIIAISKPLTIVIFSYLITLIIYSNYYSTYISILLIVVFIMGIIAFSIIQFYYIIYLNKIRYLNNSNWSLPKWCSFNNNFEFFVYSKKMILALLCMLNKTSSHGSFLILFCLDIIIIYKIFFNIGYYSRINKLIIFLLNTLDLMFLIIFYLGYLSLINISNYSIVFIALTCLLIVYIIYIKEEEILIKYNKVFKYHKWIKYICNPKSIKHKAIVLGYFSEHRKECEKIECFCLKILGILYLVNKDNFNSNMKFKSLQSLSNIDNSLGFIKNNLTQNNTTLSNFNKNDLIKLEDSDLNSITIDDNEDINKYILEDNNDNNILGIKINNGKKYNQLWLHLWCSSYEHYLSKIKNRKLDVLEMQMILVLIRLIAVDLKNPYQAIIECKTLMLLLDEKVYIENTYSEYLLIKHNLFLLEEYIKDLIIENQINDQAYYKIYNSLIEYNKKYEYFIENIQSTTKLCLDFLINLYDKKKINTKLDIKLINNLTNTYNSIVIQIDNLILSYNHIVESGFEDYKVYYLYSKLFEYVYLIPNFKNDYQERFEFSLKLFLSQGSIFNVGSNTMSFINNSSKKVKLFENCLSCSVVIISGNIKELGIIKYLNNNFEKLTGYRNNELLYKNILIIIPKNIGKFHNYFLKNFYHSESSTVLDHVRTVPLKSKDNFLSLVEIMVKIYPSFNSGLLFIGYLIEDNPIKITKENEANTKLGFLLLNNDTYIEGISKEATFATGFSPAFVPKSSLNKVNSDVNNINNLIPNYTNIINEYNIDQNFEQIDFNVVNEKTFSLSQIKSSINKSISHSKYDVSKTLTSKEWDKTNILSCLISNEDNNLSTFLYGIINELESMENDQDDNDIDILNNYSKIQFKSLNKIDLKLLRIKNEIKKWKKYLYNNLYYVTPYIKLMPFFLSKIDLNYNFLLIKINLNKKSSIKCNDFKNNANTLYFNNNYMIENDNSSIVENNSLSINNNNNYNMELDEETESLNYKYKEIESDKFLNKNVSSDKLDNLDKNDKNITSSYYSNNVNHYTLSNHNIPHIKVKSIKNDSIKALLELFRNNSNRKSISNKSTLLIRNSIFIVYLFVVLFYILIYFYFDNINLSIIQLFKKNDTLIEISYKLSLTANLFYGLIISNIKDHIRDSDSIYNNNNPISNLIKQDYVPLIDKLSYNKLIYTTQISENNVFDLLQYDNTKQFVDLLYDNQLNLIEFNINQSKEVNNIVLNYNTSSLLNEINRYNYVIRKLLNIENNPIDFYLNINQFDKYDENNHNISEIIDVISYNNNYNEYINNLTSNNYYDYYETDIIINNNITQLTFLKEFYDLNISRNRFITNFILNINNNTFNYISDSILITSQHIQTDINNYLNNLYIFISIIIFASLASSIYIAYLTSSILSFNLKIFTFIYKVNKNLLKLRIKAVREFYYNLKQCHSILYLNYLIKLDFISLTIKKSSANKINSSKVINNFENSTNNSSINNNKINSVMDYTASSISSNTNNAFKSINYTNNKIQNEIVGMLINNKDFNEFDINNNNISISNNLNTNNFNYSKQFISSDVNFMESCKEITKYKESYLNKGENNFNTLNKDIYILESRLSGNYNKNTFNFKYFSLITIIMFIIVISFYILTFSIFIVATNEYKEILKTINQFYNKSISEEVLFNCIMLLYYSNSFLYYNIKNNVNNKDKFDNYYSISKTLKDTSNKLLYDISIKNNPENNNKNITNKLEDYDIIEEKLFEQITYYQIFMDLKLINNSIAINETDIVYKEVIDDNNNENKAFSSNNLNNDISQICILYENILNNIKEKYDINNQKDYFKSTAYYFKNLEEFYNKHKCFIIKNSKITFSSFSSFNLKSNYLKYKDLHIKNNLLNNVFNKIKLNIDLTFEEIEFIKGKEFESYILDKSSLIDLKNYLAIKNFYLSDILFFVRIYIKELINNKYNKHKDYYKIVLVVSIIVNTIFSILAAYIMLNKVVSSKLMNRTVLFLFPIENIISSNSEFFNTYLKLS